MSARMERGRGKDPFWSTRYPERMEGGGRKDVLLDRGQVPCPGLKGVVCRRLRISPRRLAVFLQESPTVAS